jgi:hypothetical protein
VKKIYIKTDSGTKQIGTCEGGVFTSPRKSSIHLFKKMNAWGIDCKALDGLISDFELHTVKIHDKDTQTTYLTEAGNFKKHGTILHFKSHRPQVFLPLDYWEEDTNG